MAKRPTIKDDGAVAVSKFIFEEMKSENDSSKIIAACVKAGVNKGTATTQLGRWRKAKGITVKRGGARIKKTKATDKPRTKAASKKSSSKPAPKKETVKGKGKNGDVTITRSKPSKSKKPDHPQEASSPANPATASSASESEATVSTDPAAGSSTVPGDTKTKSEPQKGNDAAV